MDTDWGHSDILQEIDISLANVYCKDVFTGEPFKKFLHSLHQRLFEGEGSRGSAVYGPTTLVSPQHPGVGRARLGLLPDLSGEGEEEQDHGRENQRTQVSMMDATSEWLCGACRRTPARTFLNLSLIILTYHSCLKYYMPSFHTSFHVSHLLVRLPICAIIYVNILPRKVVVTNRL